MNSFVSIIVPCYNQAQYLDECLQSVLEQTYENWECIIVNDGSPDDTEVVAKKWVEKDSRFQYLYKKNGGLSSARNAGIKIAKGEYILPLDAVDKIASNYCELAIQEFINDTDLKLVYCLAEKFGDEQGLWQLPEFSLSLLASDNMIFCSAFFKKSDWEYIGGYDLNMIYGLEDWEFWIHLLKNGGKTKRLEEICFFYRIKKISMIKKMDFTQSIFLKRYISVKHADFFVREFGSFHELNQKILKNESDFLIKIKSKKFLIDALLYRFFGFTFFGNKFKK